MATETYKVLGQSNPAATTLTDIYTVPALTSAIISTLVVCNRSGSAQTFRVSIAVAGAADANAQYIAYDVSLGANLSQTLTLGISLGAADVIRGYASAQQLSFNIFGVEIA